MTTESGLLVFIRVQNRRPSALVSDYNDEGSASPCEALFDPISS